MRPYCSTTGILVHGLALAALLLSAWTTHTFANEADAEEAAAPGATAAAQFPAATARAVSPPQSSGITPLIVGGKPASRSYSFYARSSGKLGLCGAVLVHKDILVSVAHCSLAFDTVCIGGTSRFCDESRRIAITEKRKHPSFVSGSPKYDIMVLKLARNSSNNVAIWNTNETIPHVNDAVTVIGHGVTTNGGALSDRLQTVDLIVVSPEACNATNQGRIDSRMICAYAAGRDSCDGDSGSPLLLSSSDDDDDDDNDGPIVVGLVAGSFGRRCAQTGLPSLYTRLSSYRTFLRDEICRMSSDPPEYCTDGGNAFSSIFPNWQDSIKDRFPNIFDRNQP